MSSENQTLHHQLVALLEIERSNDAELKQEKSLERRMELLERQSILLDQALDLARRIRDDAEQAAMFREEYPQWQDALIF